MKLNNIFLPSLLIILCPQFAAGHGKLEIFKNPKDCKTWCNVGKKVVNAAVPSNDALIDFFVGDEKVAVPNILGKQAKVEVSKKDIAKTALIAKAFSDEVGHQYRKKD